MQDFPDLIFQELNSVDLKKAYLCYYNSFKQSKVRMFSDQTDKERKQFFEEILSEKKSIINNASLVLANATDNEILGLIILQARREEAHIAILAIAPIHRGKKYGTILARKAISVCSNLGFKTMSLGVDEDNIPAYNLYKRLGFEKVSSLVTLARKT